MSDAILVTAGYDEKILFWDPIQEAVTGVIPFKDSHINSIQASPDFRYLAVAGYKNLKLFDINSNSQSPLINFEGHGDNVISVGFPKKQNWMFSCSDDKTVKVWDFRSKTFQRNFECKGKVNSTILHPNQSDLISADESGTISVWDLIASKQKFQITASKDVPMRSLSITNNAKNLIAANDNGEVHIFQSSVSELSGSKIFQGHESYILKTKLSQDSQILATCSADRTIKLWDLKKIEEIAFLKALIGHGAWVWDCEFTFDAAYLVSASTDTTAKLWSVKEGKIVKNFRSGHSRGVTCLALIE